MTTHNPAKSSPIGWTFDQADGLNTCKRWKEKKILNDKVDSVLSIIAKHNLISNKGICKCGHEKIG